MQKLEIYTPEFIRLEVSFGKWLEALNFESTTAHYNPIRVREFFHFLESRNIQSVSEVKKDVVSDYFLYLKNRSNQRKLGKLSVNTLRSHSQDLRRFTRYLSYTSQDGFLVDESYKMGPKKGGAYFTEKQIKGLYESCSDDLLGIRDRAMLSVYYGCGLRRNEGLNLQLEDVLFEKGLLYVRKGKNYTSRYVPMSSSVKEDLQNYIHYARSVLASNNETTLFITIRGSSMCGNAMAERLQLLKTKAGIEKKAGLHALRRSIATHLLSSGMGLDKIKRFLGHKTLDSTQIYAHILDG